MRASEREHGGGAEGRSAERRCPLLARARRAGPAVQLGPQVPHLFREVGQRAEESDGPRPEELRLRDPAKVPLRPQADGRALQTGQDQATVVPGLAPPGLVELARGGLGGLQRLHPGTDPHAPQLFLQALLLLPEEALLCRLLEVKGWRFLLLVKERGSQTHRSCTPVYVYPRRSLFNTGGVSKQLLTGPKSHKKCMN